LPASISRTAFAAAILAVSVLIHLGLLGVIVLAERRVLPQVQRDVIDVELVKPQDALKQEPVKPPEPQQAPKPQKPDPSQAQKPQPERSQKSAKASSQEQPESSEPSVAEKAEKPEIPSGGPPSETKSKLTAEEIAAFRAQIQKCWELPVGMPNAMKLEVVLRVALSRSGALVASPELLKAPASVNGPVLVGIAMKAVSQCGPYKTLPAAKYQEWKVLDLRFLATGLAGLDTSKPRG
jgi:hypothetical protein